MGALTIRNVSLGIAAMVVAALIGSNVYLLRQVRSLTSPPLSNQPLEVGTRVRPLVLQDKENAETRLEFSGRPTVLYYFDPACVWCERNWENVATLARSTKHSHRFVLLSKKPVPLEFFSGRNLHGLERLHGVSEAALSELRLFSTPRTIVISATGRVVRDWRGAFSPEVHTEVEEFFQLQLPGLTNPPVDGVSPTAAEPAVNPPQ